MHREGLTVVQVCRLMKRDPESRAMWRAGDLARDKWMSLGHPMTYDLRPKTNGFGTHMHAVYPFWFRPTLERIITAVGAEKDRQGDLFSD